MKPESSRPTMLRRVFALCCVPFMGACLQMCPDNPSDPPAIDESIYADALGGPMKKATPEQLEAFERGQQVALRRFDTETGLGPTFNVSFCAGCHEQPVLGGSAPRYRDFQLIGRELSDGSFIALGKSGVQAHFSTTPPYRVPHDPDANVIARRNSIPFFGSGALAALPDEAILANADPDDRDGDGISGRPNTDRGFIGRFGRKSQTVSLEGFIRGPLFNHLGVTSNPLSNARKNALPIPSGDPEAEDALMSSALGLDALCLNCQAAAPEEPLTDDDGVPDPELNEQDLFDVVAFAQLLGAPRPEPLDEQTRRGKELFEQARCTACHVPALEGPDGLVFAYSDLLLHDMGEEMADGIAQGVATGSEFRTQPLWGIAPVGPYLHDGRADTLDEAIRWHGGEGRASRELYEALSEAEREDLLAFLVSLGGRENVSAGLLSPDEPVPEVGEFGGPARALDAQEAELFAQGRSLFDRDFAMAEGLGTSFNGDSCRACHFDPVIGGAGPVGVNVTRQGIWDEGSASFYAPTGGTLLHRFTRTGERPIPDEDCNVFELRQTPPIFGLGLVDAIADETILALEDPDDADGDGISGRAHRLDDGRIGKFGWKAGLPTLEDFVRDALSNETGLTLEENASFLAGHTRDDDETADPEFVGSEYEALVFYNTMLGPPPRGEVGASQQRGEEVFETVGCAECHVPELEARDGTAVPLYSDLLLHDVSGEDFLGIEDGEARMNEFRTPPLWGIRATAPYMHDGLSPTLDHAIRRHRGEASQITARYDALSEDDRQALLDFLQSL